MESGYSRGCPKVQGPSLRRLFDEGAGEVSTIECTFFLSKDTADIDKIEEQAMAKAENLLRKALSNGGTNDFH